MKEEILETETIIHYGILALGGQSRITFWKLPLYLCELQKSLKFILQNINSLYSQFIFAFVGSVEEENVTSLKWKKQTTNSLIATGSLTGSVKIWQYFENGACTLLTQIFSKDYISVFALNWLYSNEIEQVSIIYLIESYLYTYILILFHNN